MQTTPTREQWLLAAVEALRPMFKAAGSPIPSKVRVSIGFPSKRALSTNKRTIGQCWPPTAAADGVSQLFVSPVLADPVKVLGVLVHELVHAAVGCEHGHKAPFARAAKQLGLVGKMTATEESPELVQQLKAIIRDIGKYPGAALEASALLKTKQGTRLIKAVCPTGCESEGKVYTVRITKVHLEALGAPICPACTKRMVDAAGEAFDPETEEGGDD